MNMHDWTLIKIVYKWEDGGFCEIFFSDTNSMEKCVEARHVSNLSVPREELWGPSVSVNSVIFRDYSGRQEMLIEMQSGDLVNVVAEEIKMRSF